MTNAQAGGDTQIAGPGADLDRTVLINYETTDRLTVADMWGAATEIDERLRGQGVEPGDAVVLDVDACERLLPAYLAAAIGGWIAVPVGPERGSDARAHIRDVSAPTSILREGENLDEVIPDLWEWTGAGTDQGVSGELVLTPQMREHPALMTFTSGTTGAPKGVLHSFGNLLESAEAFNQRFNFGPGDRFLNNLPRTYMAGILNAFVLPMVAGSEVVVAPRFSAAVAPRFWDVPEKFNVNVFWFTPTMVSLILSFDRSQDPTPYRGSTDPIGCVATAPLRTEDQLAFEDAYNVPLYESYGLSETLFVATNEPGLDIVHGSVGRPLGGIDMEVKEDGELAVRVPWAFHGYTASEHPGSDEDGYYDTGDLARIDADGRLYITGRKKDMILRGGVNVSPTAIERVLSQETELAEIAIVGCPHPQLGEQTVCFHEPTPGWSNDAVRAAKQRLVERLGPDSTVDRFVEVNELPKTSLGGLDRAALRDLFEVESR